MGKYKLNLLWLPTKKGVLMKLLHWKHQNLTNQTLVEDLRLLPTTTPQEKASKLVLLQISLYPPWNSTHLVFFWSHALGSFFFQFGYYKVLLTKLSRRGGGLNFAQRSTALPKRVVDVFVFVIVYVGETSIGEVVIRIRTIINCSENDPIRCNWAFLFTLKLSAYPARRPKAKGVSRILVELANTSPPPVRRSRVCSLSR